MIRKSSEQKEFEKSRKDILKMSGRESGREVDVLGIGKEEEQRYAWEIELEEYRNRKKLDRFLKFGALCGIIALIISLGLVWSLYFKL